MPESGVVVLHLVLSVIYGFIISLVVINLHELRAVFIGGIVGLVLYLINFGVVSAWLPGLRGNEVSVIVTHGVFGLITAGAYRGLLRRRVPTA
jgi:Mg/Co/Ni transporter MgtE